MGAEFAERFAHLDLYGLQNFDETASCVLLNDTGSINRIHEGSGAAVHDRHFRPVDFDGGVIDAHAAQRGQNMFGGGNERTLVVAQHGREIGGDDGGRDGGNFTISAGEDKT